jgi:hypothetical protein
VRPGSVIRVRPGRRSELLMTISSTACIASTGDLLTAYAGGRVRLAVLTHTVANPRVSPDGRPTMRSPQAEAVNALGASGVIPAIMRTGLRTTGVPSEGGHPQFGGYQGPSATTSVRWELAAASAVRWTRLPLTGSSGTELGQEV